MTTIYTYNGQVLVDVSDGKWLAESSATPVDPYNPLGLPPLTLRVRCSSQPAMVQAFVTEVAGQPGVYDICTDGYGEAYGGDDHNWSSIINTLGDNLLEVLGANSTGVTNTSCMFYGCNSLTYIPVFDTSSLTDVSYMFYDCANIESGALALYQQMSTQANPPSSHSDCFYNCGKDTVTGAAELAQIPSSWGGTGA